MATNQIQKPNERVVYDMTVGSPFRAIWKFSMPMILSMFFQQFYNFADSIIVGRFAGVDALAAVGASYPITALFIAVATGSCIGASVVVSQFFGAKQYSSMKSAISTCLISLTTIAVILTLIGLIICNPIMRLLQTPGNIFCDSALYLRVYIFGLVFLFVYNAATAVYNALGNSRTPLYFLIFSSVLNVVLDYVFVAHFHMGVAGVAWATFIAQGLSSVLAIFNLFAKLGKIEPNIKYSLFDTDILKCISRVAIPSIFQQSFISVGQLFVQGLINSYGSEVVAGYSSAFKVNTLAIMTMNTMASALSSYTAQNIGAGKLERIKSGYLTSIGIAVAFLVILVSIFLICAEPIISIFVEKDQSKQAIGVGAAFIRTLSPFYFLVMFKILTNGILRGARDMRDFMIATFSDLILRVIFSYLLAPLFGYSGIWWAYPVGWIVGAGLSVTFLLRGRWKKQLIPLESQKKPTL